MSPKVEKPALSADNQVEMYLHCGLCLEEYSEGKGAGLSPADYARLSVGWTVRGLQVWCERHSANVCNIDFEGHKHPAITSRKTDN
jgi:hypothetical protein